MFIKYAWLLVILSYASTQCAGEQALISVDFIPSMLKVAQYTFTGIKKDISRADLFDWRDFNALYTQYIVTQREYAAEARIPKIIHHIWLGSPLPEQCRQFIETWKKHHPHWLFELWDDERISQLQLINQQQYDDSSNYGEKSDIARYEILYRFGGLYLDTDFECLQPFDELHHCCDFYIGATVNSGGGSCHVYNGLIGSKPGHPVLKRCIEGIHEQSGYRLNNPNVIIERTGPFYMTRCLKAAIVSGDDIGRCVPFPPTYFYPWPGVWRFNKDPEFISSFICPETLAVHHWASSWLH